MQVKKKNPKTIIINSAVPDATGKYDQNERETKSINIHLPPFAAIAPFTPTPSWDVSKSQGKDAQQPQYPWNNKGQFLMEGQTNL